MLESTQFSSNSSYVACQSKLASSQKYSCDSNTVYTPIPVKQKTCIFKSLSLKSPVKSIATSHSFNKLDEFAKKEDYSCSPFKTERKIHIFENEENCEDGESQMVKSVELFTKSKQARLKQLRSEAKNPLGKEAFFPEKSFNNLKFARDSMNFENLNQINEGIFYEIKDDYHLKTDLLVQNAMDLLKNFDF